MLIMVPGFGRDEEREAEAWVWTSVEEGDHFRSKLGIVSSFVLFLVISTGRDAAVGRCFLFGRAAPRESGKEEIQIKHTLPRKKKIIHPSGLE